MSNPPRNQLPYGRPYVDYYPMPSMPPQRGGYTVPDPHGSESAFPKWTGASPKQSKDDGAVAQDTAGKPKEGEAEETGKNMGEEEEARRKDPTIEVEVTEIEEEEVVVVIAGSRTPAPVPVVQGGKGTPSTETDVIRKAPKTPASVQSNAVTNTAGAVFKEPESQVLKNPVCNPPHNP